MAGLIARGDEMRIKLNGLPRATTIGDLERLLARFGASEIYIARDDREAARGFGYATIRDEGAHAAIAALDGAEFLGRRLEIVPARSPRWAA